MTGKTAIVVGATGATGKHIVEQLLEHAAYDRVIVLARKPLRLVHDKLTAHVIDFDQPESWRELVQGDELYSALGTTLKQAGSKAAQYQVDYGYQLAVADAGRQNDIAKLILVSSPNASARSKSFYLKMKGELDDAVRTLDFEHCILIKPSIIDSDRPDRRPGEKAAGAVMNCLCKFLPPLRPWRPITGKQLATAMINIAQQDHPAGVREVELGELFDYL